MSESSAIDSKCLECRGKCCSGKIEVYMFDEIYHVDTLVCDDPDNKYNRLMKLINNNCIALVDGKCSIYEKRPAICQTFQVGSACCERIRLGQINTQSTSSIK